MDTEGDSEFAVNLMFPDEYQDFIAEICYGSECLCIIHQELGPQQYSIEFGNAVKHPPLDGFLDAVESAKQGLYRMRKQE